MDTGRNCSGGDPMEITGGVCFQIREILASGGDYNDSSHVIKGRFLCGDSPDPEVQALFNQYCDPPGNHHGGPGGCDTGFRADEPVLVK